MSSSLSLRFLGSPQIHLDDKLVIPDRRTVTALLAYLTVNDAQRYTREFLSSLFWPEYNQTKAFTNLRHTLWEIHKSIGDGWLITDRETISLNADANIVLDIVRFQDLFTQARYQTDLPLRTSLLVDTVKLYRNHFLTGFSLREALDFNEWVFAQSEALRYDLTSALTMLVDVYLAQGVAESAIPYARRLIALDPLNESAHRQIIEVYLNANQTSAALKQYQTCEQILHKELGIDPQPETCALYKKIRAHQTKPVEVLQPEQVNTSKHNLPLQLTTFIGRDKERDEVCNLLNKNRLVTLVGTGGIGKTRLALQAGKRLLQEYPDGVWFITLEALTESAMVPQSVASVFEIKNIASHLIVERLMNALQEKNTLLILDNCEHLIMAITDLIERLLKNCPKIKILATSREILGIDGEAVYAVPALSLSQDHVTNNLDKFEAIKLFSERAALALHKFTLTQENLRAVTGICQIVDGVPLAIELASARVDVLQPAEILEQLNKSFALLTHRGRAPVARHQSMRASMDWSWGLLNKPEQTFLQKLSIFSGGWTLEAAREVHGNCDTKPSDLVSKSGTSDSNVRESTLELTSSLVKKSLVMVEQAEGRVTRYHLHEVIRQYAREKLVDEDKIRNEHLRYYLQLAQAAEIALKGLKSGEWMDTLDLERGNLFAALEWAAKINIEAGLTLSYRLQRYWEVMDIHSGAYWLSRFINRDESHKFPAERAKALSARANLYVPLARYEYACSDAEEGLNLFKAIKDQYGEVDCLLILATAGFTRHDSTTRRAYAQRALEISRALNDLKRQAMSLNALGWVCSDQSQKSYWEKSITLLRKAGDFDYLFVFLDDLANYEYTEGNYEVAQEKFEEVIRLSQQHSFKTGVANATYAHAAIAVMNGDYDQARSYMEEAAELMERIGDQQDNTWIRTRIGHLAVLQGELQEAQHIFKRGARAFRKYQSELGLAFTLEGMANLYTRLGRHEQAARLIGWADGARRRIGNTRPYGEQADVDRIISACLQKIGEEVFSDTYDAGQAMTMDEAVALIQCER